MGKSKKLTVEDILSSVDTKEQEVEVPQWGGTVTIKPLTKEAQIRARKMAIVDEEVDEEKLEYTLFLAGVIEPKFSEEHIEALRQKNAAAFDIVLKRIMESSGITSKEEEVKTAKSFRT